MSAAPFIAPTVVDPTLAQPARVGHPQTISDFRLPISDCPEPFRVGRDGTLVVPASRLEQKPAPPTMTTGIVALDELTGGIPRGALTEVCGPASSGRTSTLLSLMARMTRAGEVCALVDASDSFDPRGAQSAGVHLQRVLWVRCSGKTKTISDFRFSIFDCEDCATRGRAIENQKSKIKNASVSPCLRVDRSTRRRTQMSRVEQALKATDLLLQGGGFGLVAVDLADIDAETARRVPLTSWFRFRRAVENTATALLVLEREPYAKTCASLVIGLSAVGSRLSVNRPTRQPSHAALFGGLEIRAEVSRDRQQRRPARSVEWESKAAFVS